MSELGDDFRLYGEMRKKKRESNIDFSTKILADKGIPFVSKNYGVHLIVNKLFDFYPSTGLFIHRNTKKRGRGIYNLIKQLKFGE